MRINNMEKSVWRKILFLLEIGRVIAESVHIVEITLDVQLRIITFVTIRRLNFYSFNSTNDLCILVLKIN